MANFLQDLGYGARMLLRNPGFAIIAVLTIALGIGANTAIFSVVETALLRGLPYAEPQALFHVWERTPQKEYSQREFSYPDYQDYQQNKVFSGLAAYTGAGGILSGKGEPQRVFAPAVSANFFKVLGVEAVMGRTFQDGEDKPGAPRTIVLTYGLWQRMFAGDKNAVGQTLIVNGLPQVIAGVLPPDFNFALRPAELFTLYQPNEAQLTRRFMHGTNLIARLKPGVTVQEAEAEIQTIASRIQDTYKESHAGTTAILVPLQDQIVGRVKTILVGLLSASTFVLLIGCANVANLLLARALSRQKEIAIRSALGAGAMRIIRQLLTESLLLSLIGGALGLIFAYWGVAALLAVIPENQLIAMPYLTATQANWRVLGFTLGISILTGIVFGLAPATAALKLNLHNSLKEGGRSGSGADRHRLRNILVIAEMALAVILLTGAGLMMKSLWRLMQVNVGFDTNNVLTMTVVLPASKYTEPERIKAFQDQLVEKSRTLPGASNAGVVDIPPLIGGNTTRFTIIGEPAPRPGDETESNFRRCNPTYFQTLGVPLIKGRFFDERDTRTSTQVVIFNKSLAERLLPGKDPIGRQIQFTGANSTPPIEIIGVVGDVKVTGLDEAIRPVVYFPLSQGNTMAVSLMVRTTTDPTTLSSGVRNAARSLEPDVAIIGVRTMDEMITTSPAAFLRRMPAWLIGVFALLALVLASIGIFGVISYGVSQQTREIGVRIALGAKSREIQAMVVGRGMKLALAGVGIGLAGAWALSRFIVDLLFGVSATDPIVFAGMAILLVGVALLACYLPAFRASRVDPMVALRYE